MNIYNVMNDYGKLSVGTCITFEDRVKGTYQSSVR